MKIAVIGAGAMGSIYAGLLADAGNEVWAVDLWSAHIDAINAQGLRVEGASGDRTVRLNATTDANDVGRCDLVIVATKADGITQAAHALKTVADEKTLILTIQNGLGAAQRITEIHSAENLLVGVAGGFGAIVKSPGHVYHNGMQWVRIGEMNGGQSARVDAVVRLWQAAGFNTQAYADVQQLMWEKFICNVAFSGPCTIVKVPLGELMADQHGWQVALKCGLEAYRVGQAQGVNFSFDDAESYIHAFGAKMPHARPSMLQDHDAGRRSEIDAINGMVPVVAAQLGLTAPHNETVTALIKMMERDF